MDCIPIIHIFIYIYIYQFKFVSVDRVFAQVSCEVAVPKEARPNEGSVFINVDMSPMAAPNFEIGR